MVDISLFKSEPITATLEIRGVELEVTFDPDFLTPALEAEVANAGNDEQARAVAGLIAKLLISWNLEQDGVPMGTEPEDLMKFPVQFLGEIAQAIGEQVKPGAEVGKA